VPFGRIGWREIEWMVPFALFDILVNCHANPFAEPLASRASWITSRGWPP
jgi:hypothetical protein